MMERASLTDADLRSELEFVRERLAELEERTRRREEDQRHLQLQARLLDALEESVIVTHLDGTIMTWNRYAELLYGWRAAELLGKKLDEIAPTPLAQSQAAEIRAALAAGRHWSGECLAQRRDGTRFAAIVTNLPLYDDAGTMIAIMSISVATQRATARSRN